MWAHSNVIIRKLKCTRVAFNYVYTYIWSMGVIKYIPRHTFEDFLTWQGRWELYDGLAVNMSPMANPKHQRISTDIILKIGAELAKSKCDCKVYQPIDIKVNDFTVYNPDVLILCEMVETQFLDTPPPLVVEVVSPSSRDRDKIVKLQSYQDFGIQYYIIVDHEYNEILKYELSAGKYVLKTDDEYDISEGCKVVLDFSDVLTLSFLGTNDVMNP